jgi:malate dehydrogenase (oxaloacetate-decarboxylating)
MSHSTTGQPSATEILADPLRNRGVAFTEAQRRALGLTGRLPSAVLTFDQQAERVYKQLQAQDSDLAKNVYMELAVYTAAAGVDPRRVIPVSLDVGTDNEALLNDPLYLGNRHSQVRGKAYDDFISRYLEAVSSLFPNALLHFEDFGASNTRQILDAYRGKYRIFNDDVQGTAAVVLAGLFNALKVTGTRWRDQRVVVFGGGTAGAGIADRLRDQMVRDGLDKAQASDRIWVVDLPGLLADDMGDGLLDY